MTTLKHFVFALAFTFFALGINTRAQTPSIEVSTDSNSAQFAVQGQSQQMQVEVYSPDGELVFDSGPVEGQGVEWAMRDKTGQQFPAGVYLAVITMVDSTGKVHKRTEQVTVSAHDSAPEPGVGTGQGQPSDNITSTNITGTGTAGKIARWATATDLGNSAMTEAGGNKIGVNITPTAILQANGFQPPPSVNTGTIATALLQTSGGKGGNTTGAGKQGGKGASIGLVSGNGGDAVAGAINGSGGPIILQPGSAGTGGVGGLAGYVLLAPAVGNVGVGTNTPTSKLTVRGVADNILVSAFNSSAVAGSVGVSGTSSNGPGISGRSNNAPGNPGVYGEGGIGVRGKGTHASGYGVVGESPFRGVLGISPVIGVYGEGSTGVNGFSTSANGRGVNGFSATGFGVYGSSPGGYAGYFSGKVKTTGDLEITNGNASFGVAFRQMLNLYSTFYAIGVQTNTQYFRSNSGFAWYKGGSHSNAQNNPGGGTVLMRLDGSGNVTATSFNPVSDRNAKANFAAVTPRLILDKLSALPIRTWNYKTDDDSVRHIGPVAQDFRAAFNLGTNDKTISTIDADGVALASIQALYHLMQEKDQQLQRQSSQLAELTRKVEQQQAQLNQVKRTIRSQARRR
jgi:hypothetical protein